MKKITAARITEYPKTIMDPTPKVMVRYEDEQDEIFLLDFYPDEINFQPEEFIGLTEEEAKQLKFKKDKEYLQS